MKFFELKIIDEIFRSFIDGKENDPTIQGTCFWSRKDEFRINYMNCYYKLQNKNIMVRPLSEDFVLGKSDGHDMYITPYGAQIIKKWLKYKLSDYSSSQLSLSEKDSIILNDLITGNKVLIEI